MNTHIHTHPFNGPLSRTTQVSLYQKVEPIWILLKQETVSGSGISWAICKSALTGLSKATHTHTRLTALCPGLPGSAGTRKVKPIWILLKQETMSGSGISWAVCKSAPRSRQITMPAPHCSVFYRPDALPATQPTASKH